MNVCAKCGNDHPVTDCTFGTYVVSATVPFGNGQGKAKEVTIEGTNEDAQEALWSLLDNLGVQTSIEKTDE
jgi:hypothetical protein